MVRKILNKNSPGTSTTYGANDWDQVNQYLTDIDQSTLDPVSIKTNTSFWDNRLRVWNPAKTKSYRIRGLAILNDQDIVLPLLTGNDEFAALMATQEMQNKTINVNLNTLRNTSNSLGQLLVGDGTKYLPLNMGSTAGHVLKINSGVNGLEWGTVAAGGGETNTASNVGSGGVGLFKLKSGVDLQFKKLNTASGGLITVTDDTANSEVDLKITGGTDGQFLKTVGTTPTWSTMSGGTQLMPDGSSTSNPRWGAWRGGGASGDGMFAGAYFEPTTGPLTDITNSVTKTIFTTAAADTEKAGWQSWTELTRRAQTPRFKIKVDQTLTTERFWTGFINTHTPDEAVGANPLANRAGLMCGFSDSDANFQIKWNNSSVSPQSAATAVAKDTNSHTIELLIDNATSSVSAWFDGTQVVNANTTQVPTGSTNLGVHCWCQAVGATATTYQMEYAMLTFP